MNLTPAEKAKELVDKMYWVTDYQAIQSSLTAVEEIINLDFFSVEGREYWNEVKTELEKL
jgi:hypothetical protein